MEPKVKKSNKKKKKIPNINHKVKINMDCTSKHIFAHRLSRQIGIYNKGKISNLISRLDKLSPGTKARSEDDLLKVLEIASRKGIPQEEDNCGALLKETQAHTEIASPNENTPLNFLDCEMNNPNLNSKESFIKEYFQCCSTVVTDMLQRKSFSKPVNKQQCNNILRWRNNSHLEAQSKLLSLSFSSPRKKSGRSFSTCSSASDIANVSFELQLCSDFTKKVPCDSLTFLAEEESDVEYQKILDSPHFTPYQPGVRQQILEHWDVRQVGLLKSLPFHNEVFPDECHMEEDEEESVAQHLLDPSMLSPIRKPPEMETPPQKFFRKQMY